MGSTALLFSWVSCDKSCDMSWDCVFVCAARWSQRIHRQRWVRLLIDLAVAVLRRTKRAVDQSTCQVHGTTRPLCQSLAHRPWAQL